MDPTKPLSTRRGDLMFLILAAMSAFICWKVYTSPGGGLLDVNRADPADLIALPDIDTVLAERIVAERRANGDYCSAQDVEDRVQGVGDARREVLAKACVFVRRCP